MNRKIETNEQKNDITINDICLPWTLFLLIIIRWIQDTARIVMHADNQWALFQLTGNIIIFSQKYFS